MKKQPIPNGKKKPAGPIVPPKERIEEDADDLVHEQEIKPEEIGEEDPDDIVHRPDKSKPGTVIDEDNMEDPDDLAHGYLDDLDDEE
jgi:hypothetical protein